MSFEEVRVGLLAESKEIGNIGSAYGDVTNCYDEAEQDLGKAHAELNTAVADVCAVGGLVIKAVDGMQHVQGDMTHARWGASSEATTVERAHGMTVGCCHELEGPVGRVLRSIGVTYDPMAQDLINSIGTIGQRAAVEEAGPAAKATVAAAEAINPDGPRIARVKELLEEAAKELLLLKKEIEDDGDTVMATGSIVAKAKESTAVAQAAVNGLATEVAEVAYGL